MQLARFVFQKPRISGKKKKIIIIIIQVTERKSKISVRGEKLAAILGTKDTYLQQFFSWKASEACIG